jgi:hypothetical protein
MKVQFYNSIESFADFFGHEVDVDKCMSITIINQSQIGQLYIGNSFYLDPQSSLTIDGNELEIYRGKLFLTVDKTSAQPIWSAVPIQPYFIVIKKMQINEATV